MLLIDSPVLGRNNMFSRIGCIVVGVAVGGFILAYVNPFLGFVVIILGLYLGLQKQPRNRQE